MLKLGRAIGWGYVGVQHQGCDLDLTFDLAVVIVSFKIFSGLNL